MASPSGTSRKDGVKCDGIIKKGARKGQVCGKLLLAKDSPKGEPSIECPSPNSYCGKHKSFLALFSEAVDIWGEPFRKKMLAVLTKENQEKGRKEMEKSNPRIEKRTIVMVGLTTLMNIEGELLPFTVGETIDQLIARPSRDPYKRIFKVNEVKTNWTKYPISELVVIVRTVEAKIIYSNLPHGVSSM